MRLISISICLGSLVRAAKISVPWLGYCEGEKLETSEFLSLLDKNRFWSYIEELATGKEHTDIISGILSDSERILLNEATKLRLFSGKIRLHEALLPESAPECETFAIFQGQTVCNPENLGNTLSIMKEDEENEEYGHLMGHTGPHVIVYSKIASPSLLPFQRILKKAASDGQIRYVYRHLVDRSCEEVTKYIEGYGIELEMKEFGKTPFIVKNDLGTFTFDDPSKEANFEEYGLKVLQSILDSKRPLDMLNFMSENAPYLVNHVKNVKLDLEVAKKAEQLAQHFNLPEMIVSINGAEALSLHFNLQTVLEFMIEYQALVRRYLGDVKDSAMVGRQLMASSLQPNPLRFDIRTSASIMLNNLEKDKTYEVWPRTYRALLRPPTGQFYPLARNVVVLTLVMNIDDLTLRFLEELAMVMGQPIPIQIIMVVNSDDEQATSGLYAINSKYGKAAAISYLKQWVKDKNVNVNVDVDSMTKAVLKELNIPSDYSGKDLIQLTRATALAKEASSFYSQFGDHHKISAYVNGRSMEFSQTVNS